MGQEIAPAGHYAFNGVLFVCPAGYYGAVPGLASPTCSGPCAVPGYYCPGKCDCDWERGIGADICACTSPFICARLAMFLPAVCHC